MSIMQQENQIFHWYKQFRSTQQVRSTETYSQVLSKKYMPVEENEQQTANQRFTVQM